MDNDPPSPLVKNQHYIQKSLILHFADENQKLFEGLFAGDQNKIFPTSAENTMSETFTYEHEDLEPNTIEKYFHEKENVVAPRVKEINALLTNLENGEGKISNVKELVFTLLPNLILFYYRSGALLTEFSIIKRTDKIPLLSKKILNEVYLKKLALTIMLGYKFSIIVSDDEFLLSDQYISTAALKIKSNFANVSNRHIGLRETLILIPLSSRYYIVFWNTENNSFLQEDTLNLLSPEEVNEFNATIINNSYLKCVAKKKKSIENVIARYRWRSPSPIYFGYQSGHTSGAIRKKEVFFYEIDSQAFFLFENMTFWEYTKLKVNDICACGSKRKFKKCHLRIYERIKDAVENLSKDNKKNQSVLFTIPNIPTTELPIDDWFGYSENLKETRNTSG